MEVFTDKHSNVKFCMITGNECADHILHHGIFEYNLIKWAETFLVNDSVFVDIGAHIGTYSVLLGKRCRRVHSFEPQSATFECLKGSVHVNLMNNINIYNVALGDSSGSANLHKVSEDGGGSSLTKVYSEETETEIIGTEEVEVRTLDSYELLGIDFLKIDVEGFELQVIKGMTKTLEKNGYPPFIFEAWPDEWYTHLKKELFEYIESLGYTIESIELAKNMFLAKHPESSKSWIAEYNAAFGRKYDQAFKLYVDRKPHDAYQLLKEILNEFPQSSFRYRTNVLMSIISYYCQDRVSGLESCQQIIDGYDHSWHVRNQSLGNLRWYLDKIPSTKSTQIIYDKVPNGYYQSSSSIIPDGDGFLMNIRLINYQINKKGSYLINDPKNVVRTKNVLVNLDSNFNITSSKNLIDNSGVHVHTDGLIRGMEDIRLISGDPNYFFCTRADIANNRTPRVCFGRYTPEGSVNKLIHLKYNSEISCEKNWLPFFVGNDLYFIYQIKPFKLCKLDPETGQIDGMTSFNPSFQNIDDFRGSAPSIYYKGGWLFTIHQVHISQPRVYYHRLVWINKEFMDMKYSRIFYFEKVGIEFNLSICHGGRELLLVYSVNDSGTKICHLSYDHLDDMLGLSH